MNRQRTVESTVTSKDDDYVPVTLGRRSPALTVTSRADHFTIVIHLRIGLVTLVSAVSGDMTSEMWL